MMSFYWQGRFSEKPSDILKHYYADAMRHPRFLEALHVWDKAQIVALAENELVPKESVRGLVKALDAMEREGVVDARTKQWNVVHGGEEYMRQHCDEGVSGWLHLGRSSPSLRVVASRIAFRKHLLGIMSSANDIRATLISVAERHTETLMPGYAYLQHIEPTTFGHYLMSWVEPLERDFERFANAFKNTNISSVGTGAAYGIEFDVNLERLDELMGFVTIVDEEWLLQKRQQRIRARQNARLIEEELTTFPLIQEHHSTGTGIHIRYKAPHFPERQTEDSLQKQIWKKPEYPVANWLNVTLVFLTACLVAYVVSKLAA